MHSASSEADRHHGRMREAQDDLNRVLSEAIPPYHDESEDANPEPLLSRSWTPTARTIGRRVRALREAKQARRAELNHVRSARKTIEAYLHELEPRQRRGNRNPSDQRGEGRGRDRPSHRGKDGGGRGRRRKEAVPKEHRAKGGPFPSGTSWRRWVSRRHDRKVGPMIGNESGRSPRHGVGALVDIRTGIAGEGEPPSSVGTRTVPERVWRP